MDWTRITRKTRRGLRPQPNATDKDYLRTLVEVTPPRPSLTGVGGIVGVPSLAVLPVRRPVAEFRRIVRQRLSAFVLIPEPSPRGAERSTASLQLRSQPLARRSGRTSALPYPPSKAGASVLLYKSPWKGRSNNDGGSSGSRPAVTSSGISTNAINLRGKDAAKSATRCRAAAKGQLASTKQLVALAA